MLILTLAPACSINLGQVSALQFPLPSVVCPAFLFCKFFGGRGCLSLYSAWHNEALILAGDSRWYCNTQLEKGLDLIFTQGAVRWEFEGHHCPKHQCLIAPTASCLYDLNKIIQLPPSHALPLPQVSNGCLDI